MFLLIVLCQLCPNGIDAADRSGREYDLKAVFIERFTRFVDWPEENSPSVNSRPFVIAIVDHYPFYNILKDYFSNRMIKNRPVTIRMINDVSESLDCHVLFIPPIRKKDLERIIHATKSKPILTIGDTEGYDRIGVHINFFIKSDHLRFRINQDSARAAGLDISYHLLKLAQQ